MVLLLALLFLSLLISFISSKRMISFSRLVDMRRGIDSRPYFASLGFLQRNVLILSSEQDIAVFAKSQAANDRGEAFVACLGVGWNVVGRHMLGACDADRHAVLAQVFKPAINRSLHQNKDKIADLVSQFVRNLPQTFDLRNGVFDGMIARVLSLICFGSSCDEREISYFVEQHRKLVLPLLRDSRARWPVIGPLLVHGNKSRVERLVNVEFVQFLAALQDDSEVLRQARAAVETGMISKLEMLQTMWELLFFNVDIGEAEIIGLCVELSKHKLDPNDVELLDAFINESARLHPGVEITFPEALGNDTVFSGQSYPKGTLVSFDGKRKISHQSHTNPPLF